MTRDRAEIVNYIYQNKSICETLQCPHGKYEAGLGKIFGCQKYSTVQSCLLSQVKNTQDNQYLIYAKDKTFLSPLQIELMIVAVDRSSMQSS